MSANPNGSDHCDQTKSELEMSGFGYGTYGRRRSSKISGSQWATKWTFRALSTFVFEEDMRQFGHGNVANTLKAMPASFPGMR